MKVLFHSAVLKTFQPEFIIHSICYNGLCVCVFVLTTICCKFSQQTQTIFTLCNVLWYYKIKIYGSHLNIEEFTSYMHIQLKLYNTTQEKAQCSSCFECTSLELDHRKCFQYIMVMTKLTIFDVMTKHNCYNFIAKKQWEGSS